ncbi:porphobilinogen synthase [Thermosulfuriphilus ammonigenes]|uniref:Delta-aminolevulinic acid dehydratase n=1 Tax=Thermosulfuriphilus ammonigenes TaxID=1936021 RepID=A0A6G7PW09_9BACT|nr:porphobilinogen synthase [Thermosulfuriphilus ammonigenes]MBA2847933.1 porphobilinogen synthase [Thermosulfuriphilus ammonigenes]QIJ71875.1 porphobilinogen synthase [Thermosulfuriphilus ammonigenes]HFB83516.1 porphobilinogen synthase [Thermodesulfatator sp.]
MIFPEYRPRRLRRTETLRSMVRETDLSIRNLIYPLFICPGKKVRNPVSSMPGVFQLSVDEAVKEAEEVAGLGIPAIILFGLPEKKDKTGSEAWSKKGVVQKAIAAIKKAVPELVIITDVCLCEYTSHGHCGLLKGEAVDNDSTLEVLARVAVSHAQAGADIVAPSDMMDGRVGRIREALDEAGFSMVSIMSYAVKYASSFYGPFREAAECAPQFGDRKSYQMDPGNSNEAIREAALDVEEGADILMVKPALPYLDIIRRLREEFTHPLAAYQVSGEYAMIKAAAERGWLSEEAVMMESLVSIRRAGAVLILTYFAKQAARLLRGE